MQAFHRQPGELHTPLPLSVASGGRTVLLRHQCPDGEWHYDWLLESASSDRAAPDDPDQRTLLAFRLTARLDQLSAGESLEAVRIEDHRRLYLEFQGPVTGNRGHVTRIAAGRVSACSVSQGQQALAIQWQSEADGATRVQSLRLARADCGSDAPPLLGRHVVRCAAGEGAAQ